MLSKKKGSKHFEKWVFCIKYQYST